IDTGEGGRVPSDRDIHVGKYAGPHHEPLGSAAFFRRAAVITHAPLDAVCRQKVLHRGRGQQRCGPQEIMTAAVTITTTRQRPRLGDAGFLRQARQRIVFAEDGDHRSPSPASPTTAVGIPATSFVTRNPCRSSVAVCSAQERNSPSRGVRLIVWCRGLPMRSYLALRSRWSARSSYRRA